MARNGYTRGVQNVEIPIVLAEGASMPGYATPGAAGMDLRSIEPVRLEPGERTLVRTGVRLAIPPGFEAQVRPRSGLALRLGVGMVNSPGTIDSDYRGEIGVVMINWGSDVVQLDQGERVAQLVVCPVVRATLQPVEELGATDRGEGGFGSTGTQ